MQAGTRAAAVGRVKSSVLLWGSAVVLVGSIVAWAPAGCGGPGLLLCGTIPEAGCPSGRGGTCDDVECAAIYDCVQGAWTKVEVCGPVGGGGSAAHGGAGGGSGGSTAGAGGCVGVVLDHSGEQSGCQPEPELPDCPAVAAEVCAPCLTSCVDFFLCMAAGWVDVAYCTDEGELVVLQQ